MKKLLMVAGIGLGLGFSATTLARDSACNSYCSLANYHCNVTMDARLCRDYIHACRACGGVISV